MLVTQSRMASDVASLSVCEPDVTGTTSAQHMKEALDIFGFELSLEDLKHVGLLLNPL